MNRDERPLSAVPAAIWFSLAAALCLQIGLQISRSGPGADTSDLPLPPAPGALRLASFGEPLAAARLAMLYVQAFDLRGDNAIPYRNLDYTRLVGWLRSILDADPRSAYPLLMASRVYADIPDPKRVRIALEFVYEEFPKDPNRRWPSLAHAALVAKHDLKDLKLARRYAAAVQRLTTDPKVPLWARQMEIFILEDMNELEAARIMLGGLLESGAVRDPGEAQFLKQRLAELEARIQREGLLLPGPPAKQ